MKRNIFKKFNLLSFVLVLMILMTACSTPAEQTDAEKPSEDTNDVVEGKDFYGGTLRVTQAISPSSFDPVNWRNMGNSEIGIHIFETPLIVDETGHLWPGVTEFEMDEDMNWLKLTVRDGLTFHNGDAVDVYDVVASIERAGKWLDRTQSGFQAYLSETEIVNDMTVIYHFSEPAYNAAISLGTLYAGTNVMPKDIIESLADDELITDDDQLIGTGPYMLKEWVKDNYTLVERHEGYIPTDADTPGYGGPKKVYFDEIRWTVVTDAMARTNGLMANEYDVSGNLVEDMKDAILSSGSDVMQSWRFWTPNIMFNMSEDRADSPIADVNLRKAIRVAIDFDALFVANDKFEGEYRLDPSLVMEGSPYHNDILMEEYNVKDVELAKQYLEASSYNGEEIIIIASEAASFYKTGLPLSQMMQDIGINVKFEIIDSSTYSSYRTDNEYANAWDITMLESQKQFNPLMTTNWLGGEDTTTGWWKNEEIEPLKVIIRSSPVGSEEGVAAFKDFSRIVLEEVPYILVGEFSNNTYFRDNVDVNIHGPIAYYWNSKFTE